MEPPEDSVAINPEAFGLPYHDDKKHKTREATQRELRTKGAAVRIAAPGLSEFVTGGTTFTISDVGDKNIRKSKSLRFDIYRFITNKDANLFGKHTVEATITNVPATWQCPQQCTR